MRTIAGILLTLLTSVILLSNALNCDHHRKSVLLQAMEKDADFRDLIIEYPADSTVFPPEIIPPTLIWSDPSPNSNSWFICIELHGTADLLTFTCDTMRWTPGSPAWETIKRHSLDKRARVIVAGFDRRAPHDIVSRGEISIFTSRDKVGAPIFYRDVNLPFIDAVKDPSRIKWRLGDISSMAPPRVVLEKLPVCGNCHSFSAEAKYLAMDVDYANDKGSYVITRVAEEMRLATSEIITWEDFEKKSDINRPLFQRDIQTFGLLSQISPDGNYVISTVRDQSVFVDKPDLAFSQLFFPVKGILAFYSRREKKFSALQGAEDPKCVQSNPSWSPDGEFIVFARSKTYEFKHKSVRGKVLLTQEECEDFVKEGKPFLFDLYRIPFNNGKGGKAEPLKGASLNGESNFFAKYSPDGKWIVFCKAKSYMLLQPDSKLYIIPAEGGEARELSCNTDLMNSWHSWSPNSKWLVFSSKANSPYTQLFLTHIDESGNSSPPVLLEQFTLRNRAANIPEFVNTNIFIKNIQQQFVDDYSYVRKGELSALYGDYEDAIDSFLKATEINPNSYWAHMGLGLLFHDRGKAEKAITHYKTAYELEPGNARINRELGVLLYELKRFDEAVFYLSEALSYGQNESTPGDIDPAFTGYVLGCALLENGDVEQANERLVKVVSLEPDDARYRYFLAISFALLGDMEKMFEHYDIAVSMDPDIDRSPVIHATIAKHHARNGLYKKAIAAAEKGLQFATVSGNKDLETSIKRDIDSYQRKLSR